MKSTIVLFSLVVIVCINHVFTEENKPVDQSAFGPAFDEIVVESLLTVKKKDVSRHGRKSMTPEGAKLDASARIDPQQYRAKRAPRRQGFGGQGQQGNAGFGGQGQNQGFGGGEGFGGQGFPSYSGSAANAQAQGFEVDGPFGGFGANSAGAQSQSLGFGPGGIRGSAGLSGSQNYKLPNGQNLAISYSDALSFNNGQGSRAEGHGITLTRPDGTKQNFQG